MKKNVEQVVGLPVDEYHGVGGEYIINGKGKRVPLSAAEVNAVVMEEQQEQVQIEQEKE